MKSKEDNIGEYIFDFGIVKHFLNKTPKLLMMKGLIKWTTLKITYFHLDFPCGSAGKESACNAGDLGSMPGLGRSPGEGKGYPLQYSDLEKSMDCIAHGVAKSRIQLNDFHLFSPRNTINCATVNYRMVKVYFHHLKPSKISYPDYKMKSYSSTKDL